MQGINQAGRAVKKNLIRMNKYIVPLLAAANRRRDAKFRTANRHMRIRAAVLRNKSTNLLSKYPVETKNMWVSTFHSACSRILRREAHHLGYRSAFSIYDSADSLRLVTMCVKDLDLDPKRFPPRSIRAAISNAKNELIDYESFAASDSGFYHEKIADVYRLYQQRLVEASALDFDDLLMLAVDLFRVHPEILQRYQDRFEYVLVDEYQDTNHAQYVLVRLLTEKSHNLCVVGDGDQSIYRFRGRTFAISTSLRRTSPTPRL